MTVQRSFPTMTTNEDVNIKCAFLSIAALIVEVMRALRLTKNFVSRLHPRDGALPIRSADTGDVHGAIYTRIHVA